MGVYTELTPFAVEDIIRLQETDYLCQRIRTEISVHSLFYVVKRKLMVWISPLEGVKPNNHAGSSNPETPPLRAFSTGCCTPRGD
jgi:hypothetical protein